MWRDLALSKQWISWDLLEVSAVIRCPFRPCQCVDWLNVSNKLRAMILDANNWISWCCRNYLPVSNQPCLGLLKVTNCHLSCSMAGCVLSGAAETWGEAWIQTLNLDRLATIWLLCVFNIMGIFVSTSRAFTLRKFRRLSKIMLVNSRTLGDEDSPCMSSLDVYILIWH